MTRALVRLVLVVLALAGAATAGSALWQPASAAPADTTYTAVAPCAVFDSRGTQGATGGFLGPINGNQPVTYLITGSFPATQGGFNTSCGIPAGATSVEINMVAVNALNEGNLRVSDGSPVTTGGVVNYNNLTPKLNTSSSVIVPLDATGHLVVTPNCGPTCAVDTTDVRGVVLGYFTDGLATRVAALEALLLDVTRVPAGVGGKDTLRFSGMNVQIVDGTGTTRCEDPDGTDGTFESCNGQGNLLVGYDENLNGFARTGAHNIIGGVDNGWTSFGGAVFGRANRITNDIATVTAGWLNQATGMSTSVSGGFSNLASGYLGSVSGGGGGVASAYQSSVSGGTGNTASGNYSAVSGGASNDATDFATSVSGGYQNTASGANCPGGGVVASSVTGGRDNLASGCHATVSGGGGDFADHGFRNTASGTGSSVSGGRTNTASGDRSSITGGTDNIASGDSSSVTGGQDNKATGVQSTVSGGLSDTVAGPHDWKAGDLFQTS